MYGNKPFGRRGVHATADNLQTATCVHEAKLTVDSFSSPSGEISLDQEGRAMIHEEPSWAKYLVETECGGGSVGVGGTVLAIRTCNVGRRDSLHFASAYTINILNRNDKVEGVATLRDASPLEHGRARGVRYHCGTLHIICVERLPPPSCITVLQQHSASLSHTTPPKMHPSSICHDIRAYKRRDRVRPRIDYKIEQGNERSCL